MCAVTPQWLSVQINTGTPSNTYSNSTYNPYDTEPIYTEPPSENSDYMYAPSTVPGTVSAIMETSLTEPVYTEITGWIKPTLIW